MPASRDSARIYPRIGIGTEIAVKFYMQSVKSSVLIWAIDAFATDIKVRESAVAVIRAFTQNESVTPRIIPATVVDPTYIGWPLEFAVNWSEAFSDMTRKALREKLEDIRLRGLEEPAVIVSESHSRRGAVKAFLGFARAEGASAIFVNTHARNFLDRVMLGSFTETLILLSPVPVVSVNPAAELPARFARVLVPTDFSMASRAAFRRTVEYARQWDADLMLFHRIPNPIGAVAAAAVSLTGAAWPMYDQVLRIDEAERREAGRVWVEEARRAGVRAEAVFEKSAAGLANAIVDAAREFDASVIAMCTGADSLGTGFHGSVARHVIREASCPVWTSCSGPRGL